MKNLYKRCAKTPPTDDINTALEIANTEIETLLMLLSKHSDVVDRFPTEADRLTVSEQLLKVARLLPCNQTELPIPCDSPEWDGHVTISQGFDIPMSYHRMAVILLTRYENRAASTVTLSAESGKTIKRIRFTDPKSPTESVITRLLHSGLILSQYYPEPSPFRAKPEDHTQLSNGCIRQSSQDTYPHVYLADGAVAKRSELYGNVENRRRITLSPEDPARHTIHNAIPDDFLLTENDFCALLAIRQLRSLPKLRCKFTDFIVSSDIRHSVFTLRADLLPPSYGTQLEAYHGPHHDASYYRR